MVDLATFRQVLSAVLDDAMIAGTSPEILMYISDQARLVCEELEARRDRRQGKTRSLVLKVLQLERQLTDRDPGERATIIQTRLGISRATYFRMKKTSVSVQSETGARSNVGHEQTARQSRRRSDRPRELEGYR